MHDFRVHSITKNYPPPHDEAQSKFIEKLTVGSSQIHTWMSRHADKKSTVLEGLQKLIVPQESEHPYWKMASQETHLVSDMVELKVS